MKRRTASVLSILTLTLFLADGFLWAETDSPKPEPGEKPQHVFKINGKPVPEHVAIVNGVKVPAQYLENQLITFKIYNNIILVAKLFVS